MAGDNGQGANLEPEQQSGGMLKDPQSRRRFLRAAAIGTAGVAGVAGAVGVAQATGAPKILKQVIGLHPNVSGEQVTITGYFKHTTTTESDNCTSTYSSTNADGGTGRYVVFYINSLPSGHYFFDVTQTIGGVTNDLLANGAAPADPTHQQWEYAQKNSSIHVVLRNPTGTAPACPADDLSGTLAFNSFKVEITSSDLTTTKDVVIYTHVDVDADNVPTLAGSTTFTFTLSGDKSGTASVPVSKN